MVQGRAELRYPALFLTNRYPEVGYGCQTAQESKPLVASGDSREQRARPGARRIHGEQSQGNRPLVAALCRAEQAAQGRSFPLGDVDADLLYERVNAYLRHSHSGLRR